MKTKDLIKFLAVSLVVPPLFSQNRNVGVKIPTEQVKEYQNDKTTPVDKLKEYFAEHPRLFEDYPFNIPPLPEGPEKEKLDRGEYLRNFNRVWYEIIENGGLSGDFSMWLVPNADNNPDLTTINLFTNSLEGKLNHMKVGISINPSNKKSPFETSYVLLLRRNPAGELMNDGHYTVLSEKKGEVSIYQPDSLLSADPSFEKEKFTKMGETILDKKAHKNLMDFGDFLVKMINEEIIRTGGIITDTFEPD